MNATPMMMPRRKTALAPVAEVVYSTSTGDMPRPARAPRVDGDLFEERYEPYCFVCHRATDHIGEHEALVAAGMAEYGTDGVVRLTEAWDAEKAQAIRDQEYRDYMANLRLDNLLDEPLDDDTLS